RCVRKTRCRFGILRPGTPARCAATARRTIPVPASKMYGTLSTMMATDGPMRSGSGMGVPVPSITILVLDDCAPSNRGQRRNRIARFIGLLMRDAGWDAEFRPDAGCRRGMRDWGEEMSGEIRPDAECGRGMRDSAEEARGERKDDEGWA